LAEDELSLELEREHVRWVHRPAEPRSAPPLAQHYFGPKSDVVTAPGVTLQRRCDVV